MIDTLQDALQHGFNQRALLAAALIGFINGCFSGFVVIRRSALFAGTLCHVLFPGVVVGAALFGLTAASAFGGSLVACLVVSLGTVWIARLGRLDKGTALGVLYPLSFAAALLIIAKPGGNGVDLEHYLLGYILTLSDTDLWFIIGIGIIVLPTLVLLQRPLQLFMFDPDVAQSLGVPVRGLNVLLVIFLVLVTITSFQAVGTILALGLLVTPGAILLLHVESPRLLFWLGGLLGATLATTGLLIAILTNLHPGALIVIVFGLAFLIAFALSPRYGLLRLVLRRHEAAHSPPVSPSPPATK